MFASTSVEVVRWLQRDGMNQDRTRDGEGQTLDMASVKAGLGHCDGTQSAKLRCRHTEAEEDSDQAAG